MQDGSALLGVQAVEEFASLSGGCIPGRVNSHVSTNLPPFGDDFFARAAVGVAHSGSC